MGRHDHNRVDDWARYAFAGGRHTLTLGLNAAGAEEVTLLDRAPLEVALVVVGPILFLVCRLDERLGWTPAPYSWHRLPPAERIEPDWPLPPGAIVPLRLAVVDAATVRAVGERGVVLPHAFAALVHGAIRAQARGPALDTPAFDRAVDAAVARYGGLGLARPGDRSGDARRRARAMSGAGSDRRRLPRPSGGGIIRCGLGEDNRHSWNRGFSRFVRRTG